MHRATGTGTAAYGCRNHEHGSLAAAGRCDSRHRLGTDSPPQVLWASQRVASGFPDMLQSSRLALSRSRYTEAPVGCLSQVLAGQMAYRFRLAALHAHQPRFRRLRRLLRRRRGLLEPHLPHRQRAIAVAVVIVRLDCYLIAMVTTAATRASLSLTAVGCSVNVLREGCARGMKSRKGCVLHPGRRRGNHVCRGICPVVP